MMVSFEAFIGHEDGGEGVKLEEHALVTANGTEILSTGVPFEERLLAQTPYYGIPQGKKEAETVTTPQVHQDFVRPAPHAPRFINLSRYPLDKSDSLEYKALVAKARAELADDGCCVLPGFLNDDA